MPTQTTVDNVQFIREELVAVLPRYKQIRDCVNQLVKGRGATYLPMPNPTDKSEENKARYAAYIERAIFYGVTGRTLGGMVAQVYARDAQIEVPDLLRPVVDDATGNGLSLIQLSKDSMRDVMGLGRGGIFTDYPKVEGFVSRQQILDGSIRPVFTFYPPENIRNWRTRMQGGIRILCLVVLYERHAIEGAFSVLYEEQYRVLRLGDDGTYVHELWRLMPANPFAPQPRIPAFGPSTQQPQWRVVETTVPRDANGQPLQQLPFEFIGAMNNDDTIDEAPLYDLSELNIGHYRNSADYEEAAFIVGQPTPWFSGLTQEWVEKVWPNGQVLLGSRAAIPLPENAMAGLLQVSPNTMPLEAMKQKEAQMVALGAKLVENRAVRRTFGEVQQSNAADTSILADCANNVSAAYTASLVHAARFVGAPTDKLSFQLNTEFALSRLPVEERNQLILELQAGAISWEEVRDSLRRGGVAVKEDTAAKTEIDVWQKEQAKLELLKSPPPVAAAQKPPQGT